jgi:replicative DNA helicase
VSLDDIRAAALRVRDERGLDWIYIDHAGLLRDRGASAYERATRVAVGLKQLARDLDCAVLCLVQANRSARLKPGEPVPIESARDSGAFEENADYCLTFSQIIDQAREPRVRVRLAKNRRGPHPSVVLAMDPRSLRMREGTDEGA